MGAREAWVGVSWLPAFHSLGLTVASHFQPRRGSVPLFAACTRACEDTPNFLSVNSLCVSFAKAFVPLECQKILGKPCVLVLGPPALPSAFRKSCLTWLLFGVGA